MDFHKALVFLWCLCAVGLKASTDSDCTKALEGTPFTITLDSPKQDGDALVWKCNETVIYERRNGSTRGFAEVDDKGSLSLGNLTSRMSCTYRAEHWSKSAKLLKRTTMNICVISKVPVPKLVVTCSPSGVASLQCDAGSSKGFTLSWFHNNKVLPDRSNPLQPQQYRDNDRYRCRLSNDQYEDDKEDSNEVVIPSCSAKVPVPKLVVTCSPSGVASLHCDAGSSKGFTLSWLHNNKELPDRSNPLTPTQHGEKDTYKCRLTNDQRQADREDSNEVTIACPKSDICTEKLEGGSHTISLDLPDKSRDSLTWKCNDTIIYPGKKTERVPSVTVDKKGSLSLTKLTTSISCTYTAEYSIDKKTATKTERLCVLPRAPVPKLTMKCSPLGEATLYCDPNPSAGLKLSWLKDTVELKDTSVNPFQPRVQGGSSSYRCRLSNSLNKQDSNAVTVPTTCKASDGGQLCMNKRVVLAVLGGAVLLFLLLTLALVTVSCQYCRQRRRKHVHEHVRLSSLRDTRADRPQLRTTPDGDQAYSRTPQEEPSPAASPPQPQPSPQPAAAAAAAEKPPNTPVPQPRKKLNLVPKAQDSAPSANGQDCV